MAVVKMPPGIVRLLRSSSFTWTSYRHSSVLYLSGRTAQVKNAIIHPDVEFRERFEDIEGLENNVKGRKLNFEVRKMKQLWCEVEDMREKKEKLLSTRTAVVAQISALREKPSDEHTQAEIEKLRQLGIETRVSYKEMLRKWWDLEDTVITKALGLPNTLHRDTPLDVARVVNISGEKPQFEFTCQSHVDLGQASNCLEFMDSSPSAFYLKDHWALLEMVLMEYFGDALDKLGLVQFCGPDFCRSVVVEGCGWDPKDPHCVFMLSNTQDSEASTGENHLHLVGSASLPPFCAYLTKQVIQSPSVLPLRFFTVGRHYEPVRKDAYFECGLFSTWQSTAVQFFIATENNTSELEEQYNVMKKALYEVYRSLGLHFRMINVPAYSLGIAESLKTSIELYSPHFDRYIEVGNIAVFGDFISKRLRMYYHDEDNSSNLSYLSMLSGMAVCVPRLLAAIIENTQNSGGSYKVPEILKPYLFGSG